MDDLEISRLKQEYRRHAAEFEAARQDLLRWREVRHEEEQATPSGGVAPAVLLEWRGTLDEWERIVKRMRAASEAGLATYRKLRDAGLKDRDITG